MRRLLALVVFLWAAGAVAWADSFQVFQLNTAFGPFTFATGTLTLDTTTELFTAENITLVDESIPLVVFSSINSQQSLG